MDQAVVIVGTGRLAQALGRLFVELGVPLRALAGRDRRKREAAAAFVGGGVEAVSIGALPPATHVVIAVSDSAIESVAGEIAAGGVLPTVAVHTCGGREATLLAELRQRDVACGVMHPFQTAATPEEGLKALRRCAWAVSGDEPARRWARKVLEPLAQVILELPVGAHALYHSAGVMASNFVVATIAAARDLLCQALLVSGEDALRALGPLAQAAVSNAIALGPEAALTGPIQRGDADTVSAHLEALERAPAAIRELYRAAAFQTLELAARKGLDPGAAAILKEALRRPSRE